MSPALYDFAYIAVHSVNQTIFIIDAAAPVAGQVAFQWFRLTDALISAPLNVWQQVVDPIEDALILALPVKILAPTVGAEFDLHQLSMFRSSLRLFITIWPVSIWAAERRSAS
jgi:hypothetical protein